MTTSTRTTPTITRSREKKVENMINDETCIETEPERRPISAPSASTESLPPVDIFINPEKAEAKEAVVEKKMSESKLYFSTSLHMKTVYANLFRMLWYSTLPCVEDSDLTKEFMIKSCEVAGEMIDCKKLFERIPTDSGMCCALNSESALRDSEFLKMVEEMQGKSDDSPKKEKVDAKVGRNNGLRLTLDLHSDTISFGTIAEDFQAFTVFIGGPAEFPVLRERGIQIQPGHEHFLDIQGQTLTSTGIEDLNPEDRRCYFQDEGNLEFYDKYTFSNCKLECGIKVVEKMFNCIPWYLPQMNSSQACDPWTARNFSYKLEQIHGGSSEQQCYHCLPDCEEDTYTVLHSQAKFR